MQAVVPAEGSGTGVIPGHMELLGSSARCPALPFAPGQLQHNGDPAASALAGSMSSEGSNHPSGGLSSWRHKESADTSTPTVPATRVDTPITTAAHQSDHPARQSSGTLLLTPQAGSLDLHLPPAKRCKIGASALVANHAGSGHVRATPLPASQQSDGAIGSAPHASAAVSAMVRIPLPDLPLSTLRKPALCQPADGPRVCSSFSRALDKGSLVRPIAMHAKRPLLPIPLPLFKSGLVDGSTDSCGKSSAFTSPAGSSRLSKRNSCSASDTVASFGSSWPAKDVATSSAATGVSCGLKLLKPRDRHPFDAAVMSAAAPDIRQVCISPPL